MIKTNNYICPSCNKELLSKLGLFICTSCGNSYKTDKNITLFTDNELFYSVFSKEDAIKVAELSEQKSWRFAIDNYSNKIGKYTYNYIVDESRADWLIYLPTLKNSIVLDIGSGWGNIAIMLAKRCEKYYCCDANVYNLRLLNSRLRDNNINNTELFQYDANDILKLPFNDKSVDVVILNGVLEWMGNIEHKLSPRQIQIMALKEINRVLKKDGIVFIGIENRYAMGHLLGARPHGEIPFIGLLPRFLSNIITKLKTGKRHGTYIYSVAGYRKLLHRANFKMQTAFLAFPDYRFPNTIVPLKPKWMKRFWVKNINTNNSKKIRLAKTFGLKYFPFHWFANSFLIIGNKK